MYINKTSYIYNTAIVNSSMEQEQASEMPRAAGAGGREEVKVPKVSSAKYRAFVDRLKERVNQALRDDANIPTADPKKSTAPEVIIVEGWLQEKIGVKEQTIQNKDISSQQSTITDHIIRLAKRSNNPK